MDIDEKQGRARWRLARAAGRQLTRAEHDDWVMKGKHPFMRSLIGGADAGHPDMQPQHEQRMQLALPGHSLAQK